MNGKSGLPFEDLDSACRVLQPSAVLLSTTRPAVYQVHKRELLDVVRRANKGLRFYVGGQGAPSNDVHLAQLGVKTSRPAEDPRETFFALAGTIRESAQAPRF